MHFQTVSRKNMLNGSKKQKQKRQELKDLKQCWSGCRKERSGIGNT